MHAAVAWWRWSAWAPRARSGTLEHLVCAGADEVLVCRDERLRQNDAEVYARLICDLVAERKPEAILYGATAFGRELAPGVAVRLQTGLTADRTVPSMDAETGCCSRRARRLAAT